MEAPMVGDMHDMTQQDATLCVELPPKQHQVIAALASGASVSEAARLSRVHRSTVHRWLAEDSQFVEQLSLARAEQVLMIQGELKLLAVDAVRTLRELMSNEYTDAELRFKVTMTVLQALKCPGLEAIGETDEK